MSAFVEFALEVLQAWRPVTAKRMFGGHGIYHAGLMFALIADGALYLKVDDESLADFEAMGLKPFEYEAKGRRVSLSYRQAPDALLDEPDVAREWAERGWQAALRAHLLKKAKQEARPRTQRKKT
jgi:DNA transformation protein and related proteins